MLTKMTEEKSDSTSPPAIVMVGSDAPKRRLTKKYVIIGATVVLTLVIILAAILIGMYFFTEAERDMLKYTLKMDNNKNEDVTNYPDSNVISYHANTDNYETWVVEDYNKDIQVFKIKTQTDTNCYAVPFNKTTGFDVSKIKIPPNTNIKVNSTTKLNYIVANTPIADTSFLSKQARDECQGISMYWLFPSCDQTTPQRKKRSLCYYQYTYCCTYCWGWCCEWCDYYLCY